MARATCGMGSLATPPRGSCCNEWQVKLVPGPYTAETFEVRVEDDYVVLEV